MEIMFVRHADPDYKNDCLTEKGRVEATAFGERLSRCDFDAVYTSPMGRAVETMELVMNSHSYAPTICPWLHELDGRYRGDEWAWDVTRTQMDKEPELVRMVEDFMMDAKKNTRLNFDALLQSFGYRRNSNTYLIESTSSVSKKIIAFSHQGTIETLLGDLLGCNLLDIYANFHFPPLGFVELTLPANDSGNVPLAVRTISGFSYPGSAKSDQSQTT